MYGKAVSCGFCVMPGHHVHFPIRGQYCNQLLQVFSHPAHVDISLIVSETGLMCFLQLIQDFMKHKELVMQQRHYSPSVNFSGYLKVCLLDFSLRI